MSEIKNEVIKQVRFSRVWGTPQTNPKIVDVIGIYQRNPTAPKEYVITEDDHLCTVNVEDCDDIEESDLKVPKLTFKFS